MKLLSIQDKNEYGLWKPTEKCLKWPICTRIFVVIVLCVTAWKVSVLGVFLVRIFSHWIKYLEIVPISPYSVKMQENVDQKNSEYRHFSRSVCFDLRFCSLSNISLYCNNIGSHTGKSGKYCSVCEALLINRVFENIFRQYFG